MSDITVYSIDKEQAENASGLMLPEQAEALGKGLPIAAFAAALDGEVIGTLAGAAENGVFYIQSLYVHRDHRRLGAGRALVEELDRFAVDMDLGLKAEYTLQNEDGRTLAPFLEALDFVEDPVHFPNYCLAPLKNLHINVGASAVQYSGITSFFETSKNLLEAASVRSRLEGYPLPAGGLLSSGTDPEMSYCSVRRGRVSAYVAVEALGDGMVRIPALWSELNDPREMMVMLSRSIEKLRAKFSPDTRIAMLALSPTSLKLIEHICGRVEQCSFRYIRKF